MSPIKFRKPTKSKLERKSRIKYNFPVETLVEFSHFRQDDAAKKLGVAPITLKRICQRHKYRWPYRSIKARLRREAAARNKANSAHVVRMKTPISNSVAPELLLMLRQGKKEFINASPMRSPMASFPLVKKTFKSGLSPTLPPLTWLLQRHQQQPTPVTPPHFNGYIQPMPRHYKSSFFAASFDSSAPKFPLGKMTSLLNQCETERRLLPPADLLPPRSPHRYFIASS